MKDEIRHLLDEMTRLGRAERSPDLNTRSAARREMRAAAAKLAALRAKARDEFAAARGWKFALDLFTSDYPVLDHVDHYVNAQKRLAAIVTHSYATMETILGYAQRNRMRATKLEFSTYNPGGCIAVLLEPLAGAWRRPRRHENTVRFELVAA